MEYLFKLLVGLKVVEFGILIVGFFVLWICVEFGVEVIKIELFDGGDLLCKWCKFYEGILLWWFVQVCNKKFLIFNFKYVEGQVILKCLFGDVDILIENFCFGVLEKFGLGWDVFYVLNLCLVMVCLLGFGQIGFYKDQLGFGVVGELMGGLCYIIGFEDCLLVCIGIFIGDLIVVLWGVIGVLMVL